MSAQDIKNFIKDSAYVAIFITKSDPSHRDNLSNENDITIVGQPTGKNDSKVYSNANLNFVIFIREKQSKPFYCKGIYSLVESKIFHDKSQKNSFRFTRNLETNIICNKDNENCQSKYIWKESCYTRIGLRKPGKISMECYHVIEKAQEMRLLGNITPVNRRYTYQRTTNRLVL